MWQTWQATTNFKLLVLFSMYQLESCSLPRKLLNEILLSVANDQPSRQYSIY